MTDPLDISYVVLTQLADLVRKLPPEQIIELYEGTAKLEIVPKGGRPAKATAGRAPAKPREDLSIEQIRTDLSKIDDRAAAAQYVKDLKLKVDELRTLAKDLDISVAAKATGAVTTAAIVQWTVGRRLDSDAVSRPAPSTF